MISFDNLMLRALQVLNARLKKENTATRIGSLFQDILLYFNNLIQNAILGIIIKGEKANEAEIKAIADPAKGDTYKAIDTKHYWTYDGTQWNDVGEIIPSNVVSKDDLTQLESKLQPTGTLQHPVNFYFIGGYDSTANSITPGDINLYKTSGYIKNKAGDRIKIKGAYSVTSYDGNMQNRQTNINAASMANDFVVFEFIRDGYYAINYEFSPGGVVADKIGDINAILVAFYPLGADIVENKVDKEVNARLITEHEAQKITEVDKKVNADALSDLGTVVKSKNRIDPAFIVPGLVSSSPDYGLLAHPDWNMAVFVVTAGEIITVSGWNSAVNLMAFMKGDIPPLPLTVNYRYNIVKSGSMQYVLDENKTDGKITFTVPPEATWGVLTVANATEPDTVFERLQAETGTQATDYMPYGAEKLIVDPSLFSVKTDLTIRKNNDLLIIRSGFNTTKDIIRKVTLTGSGNGASNLLSTSLIEKTDSIEAAGVAFHGMNDTMPAPFQMRTNKTGSSSAYMNIAGNHGIASVANINCPSHGKTSADLWSIWAGANGAQVYLVEIIDSNNLRYACKPFTDTDGFDKITAATSPLTHVSGAANTADIIFTGSLYEYKPAIRDVSVKVFADDKEITENGDYSCNELKVIDKHIVADPTQITIQTPYYPYNNGAMIENTVIHRFTKFAYISELLPVFKKSHSARNISPVQPQCLTKGAYTGLKAFSMNINPKAGHDFDLGVDLGAGIDPYLYINNTDLKDQSKHYQQLSEILYSGTQPSIGMGAGYLPIGVGKSDIQPMNPVILGISTAEKYYPYGKAGIVALNEIPRCSGFISYFDASVNPDLSMCFLVPYSSGYLLYLKLINAVTNKVVYLPKEVLNREYENLWSGNISLITDDYTTNEGLIISGNVGDYCVLNIR